MENNVKGMMWPDFLSSLIDSALIYYGLRSALYSVTLFLCAETDNSFPFITDLLLLNRQG